ncbi:Hypothetical predicted protein [Mytilus galloprovincialis]|uniref:Uncharacterized protein n=1 Tax=Mytilus galloprovincialis TaxID=29158 RepID=A0A8B6FM12_MYTGA|nr:Hypothetical predicted protein [Mytilus galloprovincialis]
MDILGFVTVPGWVLTIIIIIITLYLYSLWHHNLWRRNGVPGPRPTPFLGVLPLIKKHGLAKADLELVTKYGSVVGVYNGLLPVLLVTDPVMIKEIFIKEFSNFTNRPIPFKMDKETASGVGTAFDNHWKFLRSTLSPTFSSGKQKLMVPKIQRCCADLVENIQQQREQGHVDMKEVCGAYTMDIFKFKFLLIMLFPFLKNLVSVQLSSKAVNDFFKNVVDSAIELRKKGQEVYNDFLQLMLNARHDGTQSDYFTKGDVQEFKNRGLNNIELKENAVTFFIAGYDTTANTLSFACYCLATNQDVQGKCIDEIENVLQGGTPQMEDLVKLEYLDRFFNEVLRLYGAASRFHRAAREGMTVCGVHIPKGVNVGVPVYALHRNPKYWPDPERFDSDRFTDENKAKRPEYTFVPFGVGPRICIGMRLALMEAKMALVFMLQRFTFSPCSETEIPVELEQGAIIRAKNGIKLNINKR